MMVIQVFLFMDVCGAKGVLSSIPIGKNHLAPAIAINNIQLLQRFSLSNNFDVETAKQALQVVVDAQTQSLKYKGIKLAVNNALKSVGSVSVVITAENGNYIRISIPDARQINDEKIMQAIYRRYVAKLYAVGIALGNGPANNLYVDVVDEFDQRQADIEKAVIGSIRQYFDDSGECLLGKVGIDGAIEILPKPKDFIPHQGYGLFDWVRDHYGPNEEYGINFKSNWVQGEKMVTFAIDIGGTTMKPSIYVGDQDWTYSPLFFADDNLLASRPTFEYREGDSGETLDLRIERYVLDIKAEIENSGLTVNGVFINIAGVPDYLNDRMASVGANARAFPQKMIGNEDEKAAILRNMDNAGRFVTTLLRKLRKEGIVFAYGNDMIGWAKFIAYLADLRTGVIMLDGAGKGLRQMKDGVTIKGANEFGHLVYDVSELVASYSPDSPAGSFEDWAGSERSILRTAQEIGLSDKIATLLGINVKDIQSKHIGDAAANMHPKTGEELGPEQAEIKNPAIKVWDIMAEREAQHIILTYELTGATEYAIGGGSFGGKTGPIRQELTEKYVKQYCKDLGIKKEIKITLVQAVSAAPGAALASADMVRSISLGVSGEQIIDQHLKLADRDRVIDFVNEVTKGISIQREITKIGSENLHLEALLQAGRNPTLEEKLNENRGRLVELKEKKIKLFDYLGQIKLVGGRDTVEIKKWLMAKLYAFIELEKKTGLLVYTMNRAKSSPEEIAKLKRELPALQFKFEEVLSELKNMCKVLDVELTLFGRANLIKNVLLKQDVIVLKQSIETNLALEASI